MCDEVPGDELAGTEDVGDEDVGALWAAGCVVRLPDAVVGIAELPVPGPAELLAVDELCELDDPPQPPAASTMTVSRIGAMGLEITARTVARVPPRCGPDQPTPIPTFRLWIVSWPPLRAFVSPGSWAG